MASFDREILRTTGVRIVADLWAHGISAELAAPSRSTDELLARYNDDEFRYIFLAPSGCRAIH